jgi:antitoxin MazE
MNATATIQQWGNSQGIRLTKDVLASAGIAVGDKLKIEKRNHGLFIQPEKSTDICKMTPEEIFASIPSDYKPQEYDWGKTVGKEIW